MNKLVEPKAALAALAAADAALDAARDARDAYRDARDAYQAELKKTKEQHNENQRHTHKV